MEKRRFSDSKLLCRACLNVFGKEIIAGAPQAKKHDIFQQEGLAEQFTICTSLPVDSLDEYPRLLCDKCYNQVQGFYEFKLMCIKSKERFSEILKDAISSAKNHMKSDAADLIVIDSNEIKILRSDFEISKNVKIPKRRGRPSQPKTDRTKKGLQQIIETNLESKHETFNDPPELREEAVVSIESMPIIGYHSVSSDCSTGTMDKMFPEASSSDLDQAETVKAEPLEIFTDEHNAERSQKSAKTTIFECDTCSMRFLAEHRLIAHKRIHDGLMPYPCPYDTCARAFNRQHCLMEHLKQHDGTNTWYACQVDGCKRVYKHKPTLSMHLRKYHQQGPEVRSHVCEVCGKVFKAAAVLNDHRYTHKDKSELPYACDQPDCQRRFSKKEKLKIHLLRHAGIKNFVCSYCGLRKTTRNELKIHINYHTLERTWPCRFCSHVCNSAGNLKMHVRTVHERAKDYACSYCGLTFAKPDTRKYHEMTHTGEKPNECTICGKRFIQPAALRTHKKIHLRQQNTNVNVAKSDGEVNAINKLPNIEAALLIVPGVVDNIKTDDLA